MCAISVSADMCTVYWPKSVQCLGQQVYNVLAHCLDIELARKYKGPGQPLRTP
jgi:hypothetical protein